MIDLSDRSHLRWLAHLVRAIRRCTGDHAFFIAGAQARDLLIAHAHGIDTGRATQDVDFAVMLEGWAQFEQLRQCLLATREFAPGRGPVHRLLYGKVPVDLIPFGAVERSDRTIAWPPSGDEVMTTLGFKEVLDQCETVRLPDAVEVQVASIPAQAVLKLIAWANQSLSRRGKDAQDFRTLARAYGQIEQDRLLSETRLIERDDFDVDAASAWLLGSDAGTAMRPHARADSPLLPAIYAVLDRETNPAGSLTLVSSMGGHSIDENLKLATWFRDGFASCASSTKVPRGT